MASTDKPSVPATSPTAAPAMDFSEVRKVSFWVSQLCVIVATVLGVYLAATQGFKQALAYGDIQSDKANCYLRQSLRSEIGNNVTIVRAYVEKLKKNDSFSSRKAPLPLENFVWENMKFSPATLETPAELLSGNIEFLRKVNAIYGELSTSGVSTEYGLKKMEEALEKMEKEVLPKFDANIDTLKTSLKKRDIEI